MRGARFWSAGPPSPQPGPRGESRSAPGGLVGDAVPGRRLMVRTPRGNHGRRRQAHSPVLPAVSVHLAGELLTSARFQLGFAFATTTMAGRTSLSPWT